MNINDLFMLGNACLFFSSFKEAGGSNTEKKSYDVPKPMWKGLSSGKLGHSETCVRPSTGLKKANVTLGAQTPF